MMKKLLSFFGRVDELTTIDLTEDQKQAVGLKDHKKM